jgi:radical SAM protein with 4Fe4S-binding SPASM domain
MIEIGNRPAVIMRSAPIPESSSIARALADELRKFDIAKVLFADANTRNLADESQRFDYLLLFDPNDIANGTKYAHYIEDADAIVVISDPEFADFVLETGRRPLYVANKSLSSDNFANNSVLLSRCSDNDSVSDLVQEVLGIVQARTNEALRPSNRLTFQNAPLPRKLTLELFGGCQLRCPLCPTGNRLKPGRGKGPMKIETVKALLDEIGDYVETIDLFNWGEPFLNRDACKIIRMISDRGIRTVVSSNLQHIPEPHEIIESGLSELIVSCHGITQQTYEKYMIGGSIERTLTNIDRILVAGGPFMKLKLILRFVVFAHNEHELPLAQHRFVGTPVVIEAAPMRMDMRDEILQNQDQNLSQYGNWVPASSRFYDKEGQRATRAPLGCNLPFEESVIDVDGSVSMCCSSFDPQYNVGNVLKTGFLAVWDGHNYREARRVVTGRGETGNEKVICRTCKHNGYRDF